MRKRICYQKGNMYALLCIPKPSTQIKKTSKVLSTQSQNILPDQWKTQSHQGKTAWEPDDLPNSSLLLFLFWKRKRRWWRRGEKTRELGRAHLGALMSPRPQTEGWTAGLLLPLSLPAHPGTLLTFFSFEQRASENFQVHHIHGSRFLLFSFSFSSFLLAKVFPLNFVWYPNLGRITLFWACTGDVNGRKGRGTENQQVKSPTLCQAGLNLFI